MRTSFGQREVRTEARRPLDEAIAGALEGDRPATDDLLWYCQRIAVRALASEHVADGRQALAELAMSKVDPGRGAASCWAYLLAAARTGVRRALGRRRSHFEFLDLPDQADLERVIDQARLSERLHALVRELPPKKKEVVERFYFRGESVAMIADAHGCPIGTIKARLHVARQQLRMQLRKGGGV